MTQYTVLWLCPILLICSTFFLRLEALDPDAYTAFHASHNLQDVVERCLKNKQGGVPGLTRKLSIKTRVMTPVKPMLVRNCFNFFYSNCR